MNEYGRDLTTKKQNISVILYETDIP